MTFVRHEDTVLQDLGGGFTRRILAWNDQLMATEMTFEAGTEVKPHSHPHTQCTYIIAGRFRYTVDGETAEVGPGDSAVVPGGAVHGMVCTEAPGKVVEMFAPKREDFLAK